MTKGGKRYRHMERDGNWFAHCDREQSGRTREACTSTRSMLPNGAPHFMLQREQYPKLFINSEKKIMGRNYPFSKHDNRAALKDSIETYNDGLGRKKCLDDRRQHNSHFCLRHDGVSRGEEERKDPLAGQADFMTKAESVEVTRNRRFPRSHLERSRQAAVTQAGESYMWFARNDLDQHIPFDVLALSNHSPFS